MKQTNILLKVAFFVFIIFAVTVMIKQQFDLNELKDRKKELEVSQAELNEKINELQTRLDAPFDDDYVIEIATQKLNLRLPEEIIFYNDLNK